VTLPAATDGREHPVDRLLDAAMAKHNVARTDLLKDGVVITNVEVKILERIVEIVEG
jgi:hypothetical protein